MSGAPAIVKGTPLASALGAGCCAALLALGCGSASEPAARDAAASAGPDAREPAASNGAASAAPDGASPASPTPAAGTPVSELEPGSDALRPGEYGGVYSVPVPVELEPYAAFEVESVRLDESGSELRLSYDLPELLLGEHRRLAFRGTLGADGRHVLDGDDGVATCVPTSDGFRCDEVLSQIEPDTDALERLLAALPDVEASARRAVADQFAIDPIGVLRVSTER